MADHGPTTLVLGASSSFGIEIVRRLHQEGGSIMAHACSSADRLRDLGMPLTLLQADLSKQDQIQRLIEQVKESGKSPDRIVHLAAPAVSNVRFRSLKWEDFQGYMDVQLKPIISILNEFLPVMSQRGRGKIVFVLSSYVLNVPPKFLAHYITAKFALLGLMRALASEYADKMINVNAVSPSMAKTGFLKNIPGMIVDMEMEKAPHGRLATPSDVAAAVCFLLSENADYINGVNIPVAGGTAF